MELLLLFIQIPLLVYILRYIRKKHEDVLLINAYYYLLSLKVTFGLFLGILYFNYYKVGDTFLYFDNLTLFSKLCYTDFNSYVQLLFFNKIPEQYKGLALFAQPRAYFFVRLISPFYILSGSNYWLLSVYLSVFSFSGLWILSNTLIKLFKLNSWAVMISFFLFPSVVFWSSGVIKESLCIASMAFIINIALNMVHRRDKFPVVQLGILLVFSWILYQVKFYYFAVLFATLIPYCLIKIISVKSNLFANDKRYRLSALILFMIGFSLLISFSHPMLHINRIAGTLYANYTATLALSKGNNVFYFNGINEEAMSFLPHLPVALCYGLFGPFLWQCKKIISLAAGLENTFLLILFITFILSNFKKEKIRKIDIEEVSLLFYITILAVLMAIASPNWGTLVRYKIGFLPFFLLLILNSNPFIAQLEKSKFFKRPDTKL